MFVNPEQNVARLGLQEGMSVADLGAGSGFYARAASKRVGHTGHVYAVEVQKEIVKRLEQDIKEWGISNIECILGDIEKLGGTKIADASMDVVIISNVLFQVEDKLGLIDEISRILKKNGKVLLVDWIESLSNDGHAKHYVISEEKAKELFSKRGFKYEEVIGKGDHQYAIIFIHE